MITDSQNKKVWVFLKFYALFIFLAIFSFKAQAQEYLGELRLGEIYINPVFKLAEPQAGSFHATNSYFSIYWTKERSLAAVAKVGSQALINAPAHYQSSLNDNLGLIEAYGQYTGAYGRLRAGLIPLDFGEEGRMTESQLSFPRHMLFRNRVVALRDFGVSYYISHNYFFTQITVHNGEGGANVDDRMWHTGRWGWDNGSNFALGVVGQTGSTKPIATTKSGHTLAGVDVNKEAQWRLGQLFFKWQPKNWKFLVESTWGDLLQEKHINNKFLAVHSDIIYDLNPRWSLLARYDHFDPNDDLSGDTIKEISAGLAFRGAHSNSVLYVIATKVLEESGEIPNDEIIFSWALTPKL